MCDGKDSVVVVVGAGPAGLATAARLGRAGVSYEILEREDRVAHRPRWENEQALRGDVLHSRDYRDGHPYRDRDVLVVGMGNTGAEIALDLVERSRASTSWASTATPWAGSCAPSTGTRRRWWRRSWSTHAPTDGGREADLVRHVDFGPARST